jgi:hypothetical protein
LADKELIFAISSIALYIEEMTTSKASRTRKSNKQRTSFLPRRQTKIMLLGVAALFVIAQLSFDVVMLRRQIRQDDTTLITLLENAAEGVNKPAAIDPSGAVYLTDAKIKLPRAWENNIQIMYSYLADTENPAGNELHVTTKQAVSAAAAKLWSTHSFDSLTGKQTMFDQVPHLQACSRGVTVLFDAKTAANYRVKPENTKHLKDGRTIYLATDDVATCGESLNAFVDYLKQAESY